MSKKFTPHRPFTLRPLMLAMALSGAIGSVWAATTGDTTLPTGMTCKVGCTGTTVSIDDVNNVMKTTQTGSKAVWEAQDFSVGAKAAFVNSAASANSDTLIRVVGGSSSVLAGSVTANNRLWLVNSNGLYVSSSAVINVGSLLMSARDVDPAEVQRGYSKFMAGEKVPFLIGANSNDFGGGFIEIDPGATVNANGGIVMVAAQYIYNRGALKVGSGGEVSLLVANDAEVAIGDSGFITLAPLTTTAVDNGQNIRRALLNEGTIQADNGNVKLIVAGAGNDGVQLGGSQLSSNLQVSAGAGLSVNGVANTGTILARVTQKGGKSSVLLKSVEGANGVDRSFAYNSGTIDVSAVAGVEAAGGSITLVAPLAANGGVSDSAAVLNADGDLGGGSITLASSATGIGIGMAGASNLSLISADARVNGQGGSIQLLGTSNIAGHTDTNTSATAYNGTASTSVYAQGIMQARGGTAGGDGGKVVFSGTNIITRVAAPITRGAVPVDTATPTYTTPAIDVTARSAQGRNGWIRLLTPELMVGSAAALAGTDTSATLLQDTDVGAWLSTGANVQLAAYSDASHSLSGGRLTPFVEMLDGTQITSTYAGAQQFQVASAGDIYLGRDGVGADITIESLKGPMGVTLTADTENQGWGSIYLVGVQPSQLAAVQGGAQAQATSSGSPVVIATNGGDITINGRSNLTQVFSTGNSVVTLNNVLLDAGNGKVTVTGSGASVSGEGILHFDGIAINDSEIYGSDVTIIGRSQGGTGVSLTDSFLSTNTNGNIVVRGGSEGSNESGTHVGVAANNLSVELGASGRFELTGRAVGGASSDAIGVNLGKLAVSTSGVSANGAVPRVTVVGESGASTAPGLNVTGGIQVYGNDGPSTTSTAEVVLGAKASYPTATNAMTLGSSSFNTTGRINVRPLGVKAADLTVQDDPTTQIYVGNLPNVPSVATNFLVTPNLFNGTMGTGLNIVVGSSGQIGSITVGDYVFNGTNVVTLQNQGAGSGGISLGAQGGELLLPSEAAPGQAQAAATAPVTTAGVLNLVTTGKVSQTGPLVAQSVTVVAGPQSTVDLSNTGNKIDSLLISGGSSSNVKGVVTPSSSGTVTAFDAPNDRFITISATTNREGPVGPTPDEIVTPSRVSVESTETLAELRTDVYVRGQFTRPQVCTPANTGGNAAVDLDADPLSQQWLQVRRSAQLSSCSGVRNDSSCSAF